MEMLSPAHKAQPELLAVTLAGAQTCKLSELFSPTQLGGEVDLVVQVIEGAKLDLKDDLHEHGVVSARVELVVQSGADVFYQLYALQNVPPTLQRDIVLTLVGAGAKAHVRCLCSGSDEQQFLFSTLQDHQAPHATSELVVKTVLDDKAKLVCKSLIKVAPGAQGTHAEQVNKNILLSRQARAVSVPTLEVLANDVTCKHGAAVSRIDDEQLFYLQSRGMNPEEAHGTLIDAFLR